ncbi:MAG: T9SS type A sorting domain-containing protein [Flavobacteriales bacterium]|jgi:hypothetical protein|nr:T9SS type A sorting domain-containing protein [Flavobacteriales bacterium]MBK6882456.1 T9SS type A sorting domain-containing protein [Flavobacteriales bacterium]MBK7101333.1 T9SS type A sorting domain-containing protein [Flavobacteriales bacterium]MBK7112040.1 T9SS type A sorting domain-containing protein [Flavobacteriales bacterium]MBK7618937.1 T9SS type A sorting domain-containing protein [Flavobacteriales bacterium]
MKHALLTCSALLLSMLLSAQRILPIGSGVYGAFGVYDMIEYNGELVIGGMYLSFNGHLRPNLQAWDGVDHFDLDGAFNTSPERVRDLIVFNGDLIVAGRENDFGNIARWDGTTWSALGSGSTQQVYSMAEFNGELYMAGADSAVSKWNGSGWEPVGNRFNGRVNALEVYDGALYAGGAFDHDITNMTELRRLVRWSGSAWEEVGGGLNDEVMDLLATEALVVVGSFTDRGDGGLPLPHWAYYNGTDLGIPPFEDHGSIERASLHPEQGLILGRTSSYTSGWIDANIERELPMAIRAAAAFNGKHVVGGQSSGTSYIPYRGIGELVEGSDVAVLDVNNIAAHLQPNTALFSNNGSGSARAGFEVPKGESTHTIFSCSPWLIGTRDGLLHSIAPQYQLEGVPSSAGPYANVMDEAFYRRYYQVWKFDLHELQDHAAHWNDPGYEVPYAIASWPGNGDITNGEPEQLAPYRDLDNNGIYEPEAGDHPLMRGDQMVYQILHSVIDADSIRPPMEVDIHAMHYAFNDSTNADLWNTAFSNFKFVNRSGEGYDDVRFGAFTDFDLGGYNDDFVGCDSTLNLMYAYNGDDNDEGLPEGTGFGADPPAQGVLFLDQTLSAHRSFLNNGPPVSLGDLMNGTVNGMPFTDPGYPTHFQFPGGAWSEVTAGSIPGDRKSVGSVGPFTLAANDTLCIDLAFPYAHGAGAGPLWSVPDLLQRAAAVQAFYNAQDYACNSTPDIVTAVQAKDEIADVRLFPNPTTDRLTVTGLKPDGLHNFQVFDLAGQLVRTLTAPVNFGQCALRIEGLAEGMYHLTWSSEQTEFTSKTFVIIR